MALIKCPECEEKVSDKAANCIHCGCPLSKKCGKVIFKASKEFIGLIGAYIIKNSNNNEIARLQPGEIYEETMEENESKTFYVRLKGAFGDFKLVTCSPNEINKFSIGPSETRFGFIVSKVDVFDSRD